MSDVRATPAGVPTPAGRNDGVLVVDDTAGVRHVVVAAMRQHGFAVWLAADGGEAVATYRAHRGAIDVVLLDVRMPGQDGPQTLAVLRGLFPDVRCWFMSGDLGGYTEDGLHALGALGVFRKPFRLADVARRLRGSVPTRPDRAGPAPNDCPAAPLAACELQRPRTDRGV